MSRRRRLPRPAFTLIELLVVIAIIAILVALLLPAVQQVREAARKSQCQDHLHNYGVAIHSYEGTTGFIPIAGVSVHRDSVTSAGCCDGAPRIGWQVRVMPYMEQSAIYKSLDMSAGLPNSAPNPEQAAWDTIINGIRARTIQVPYARCPSDPWPEDPNWAQANYSGSLGSQSTPSNNAACQPWQTFIEALPAGNSGHGNSANIRNISGVFSRMGAAMRFRDVTDGVSNVIFVGEVLPRCHDHRTGWWNSNGMGNAHASTAAPINNMTTCERATQNQITHPGCEPMSNWNFSWGFKSEHPGGVHFLLGDDKVTMISENIDHTTYQRLGGRADNNPVRVP